MTFDWFWQCFSAFQELQKVKMSGHATLPVRKSPIAFTELATSRKSTTKILNALNELGNLLIFIPT